MLIAPPPPAFSIAAPAVLRPRDLYLPPALLQPPPLTVDRFDWRPDFIDRYLARDWHGKLTRMMLPGIGMLILGQVAGGTQVQVIFSTAGSSSWTVPVGFNPGANTIDLIGAGGNGANSAGGGGGGGQFVRYGNVGLSIGATEAMFNGLGGGGPGTSASPGNSDTWFAAAATMWTQGGQNAGFITSNFQHGPGGNGTPPGSPTLNFLGGDGGDGRLASGGGSGAGGGGAGGPNGPGAAGAGGFDRCGGGGGGGCNNGSAGSGQLADVSPGANGGNNRSGTGGGAGGVGAPGSAGANGGGGGGSATNGHYIGGPGSTDPVYDANHGPGGGGGGGGCGINGGANVGGDGGLGGPYGGGGGGQGASGIGSTFALGGQGLIVVAWFI